MPSVTDPRLIPTLDGQVGGINGPPDGDRMFSEVVLETHAFTHGQTLAIGPDGGPKHLLANNGSVLTPVFGLAYLGLLTPASTTRYAAIFGERIIFWEAHGLGLRAAGDVFLWQSGTDGIMVAGADPPNVGFFSQRLGYIIDEDNILWSPEKPDFH